MMLEAALTLAAGLIAALPQILTLLEKRMNRRAGKANADAKSDVRLLDDVLPPPPPGGVS